MNTRGLLDSYLADRALARLRQLCPPGTTVWTSVKHVSRSGMSRLINAHVIVDNEPQWISGYIARAGLFTFDKPREALRVGGCGMDMGFHVVYTLSQALYPAGFGCIGDGDTTTNHPRDGRQYLRCPSNDHVNGDRDYTPDASAQGWLVAPTHWHRDGGYALRQRSW